MNRALVDRIVKAVLYEGYLLYPYRLSAVKNRQRWTFGGLYPQAYSQVLSGAEPWSNRTECLVIGGGRTSLQVTVRFLHLLDRIPGELVESIAQAPESELPFRPVPALQVGGRIWQPGQEAVEREIALPDVKLSELVDSSQRLPFGFPADGKLEILRNTEGEAAGVLVRQQQAIEGVVELSAQHLEDGLFGLRVRVENHTPVLEAESREEVLPRALVSTHTILGVREGEFLSLMDPPEQWRGRAAECQNVGTWPVLVGEEGEKDTLLSSPIILYDYPAVAPESPGDLFDATEIDEILTLRILTLTDEEKKEMTATDPRAADLLQRTEALAREQLLKLHGTVRGLQPIQPEKGHE